ncbi:hypothetical protein WJX73_005356 [Symbiochloris irregularis]|uniref:Proteasome assembly chaperone 3 n=1 Tax=Symbiochloris irregularis TaxID=706552 RepID=A0AAW1NRW4_9CHLO
MQAINFPVKQQCFSKTVGDQLTSFLICTYADYILVIVSQTGSVGTLLRAKSVSSFGGDNTFMVDILFGQRTEQWHEVCARQLMEQLSHAGISRPLLLSLALQRMEVSSLREIVRLIMSNFPIKEAANLQS